MRRLAGRRPVTLRARLLLGTVMLIATGLIASDVVAAIELRHFLLSRVDHQLQAQAGRVALQLDRGRVPPVARTENPAAAHNFLGLVSSSGRLLAWAPADAPDGSGLPAPVLLPGTVQASVRSGRAFTTPTTGDLSYRGQAVAVPAGLATGFPATQGHAVSALVIAAPLDQVATTVDNLEAIEAAATLVLISLGVLVALGVLRLGLRPLGAIATTAQAIAAGDHARRLPVPDRDSELGRLAATLNRAFDERTASEERLRRFLADASHELRTPLTTLRAWADLYREGGIEDQATLDTAMRRIHEESTQMARLVQDLLDLARFDTTRPAVLEPVDLATLVGAVIEDLRLIHPRRRIDLDEAAEADPAAYAVLGSVEDLRRGIRNVLVNAVVHTPAEAPVTISLTREPARPRRGGPSWAVITVADRGPGIPPEAREEIFRPFVRLGNPEPAGRTGTGLGLAIARAAIIAHGGQVAVRDRAGGGAEFVIRLPLRPTDAVPGA